jgi:ATP-binding cassette subfamily B protein
MSMESVAWNSMYRMMNAQNDRRPFSMATVRRILTFARPHRRAIALFLVVSVASAALAVATPVLAGRKQRSACTTGTCRRTSVRA